jgi:hypothetical protein
MPAALRANVPANNGQSATATTVVFVIPAGAATNGSDYAVVVLETVSSTALVSSAPAGWTLLSGPDRNATSGSSWAYGKAIGPGEPGTTVTWTLDAANRCVGELSDYSGVTATGVVIAKVTEDLATSSPVLPSIASVPAGAVVHAAFDRIRGIPATDITAPTGYSQGASSRSATAYGTGSDLSIEVAYKIVSTTGTYGGEAASAPDTSRGFKYLVVIPQAVVAPTGPAPMTNLQATPVSDTAIDVTWTPGAGAVSVDIERNGTIIATAYTGGSPYHDSGLASGTYLYRARSRA